VRGGQRGGVWVSLVSTYRVHKGSRELGAGSGLLGSVQRIADSGQRIAKAARFARIPGLKVESHSTSSGQAPGQPAGQPGASWWAEGGDTDAA
jgi:hypothetical protein